MPPKESRRRNPVDGMSASTKLLAMARSQAPIPFLAGSVFMCLYIWVICTWASQKNSLSPAGWRGLGLLRSDNTSDGKGCPAYDDPHSFLQVYSGDRTFLRQQRARSPFVFIHIPATGITSMVNDIMRVVDQTGCAGVDVTSVPYQQLVQNNAAHFRKMVDAYSERSRARAAFAHLTLHNGGRIRFAIGQLPHGYCMFAEKGCTYVTILMEPVARLLAHFYFLQQNHPDLIKGVCKDGCSDFRAFIRVVAKGGDTLGLDNLQTRMLGGESFWSSATDDTMACKSDQHGCDSSPATEGHYEMAKFNLLNNFGVVGITSEMDRFSAAMNKVYGLKPTATEKAGGAERNNLLDPSLLDEETMKITEEFCKWDIKLYNIAVKIVQLQHEEVNSDRPLRKAAHPLVETHAKDDIDSAVKEAVGAKP
eukprot:gene416-1812_t